MKILHIGTHIEIYRRYSLGLVFISDIHPDWNNKNWRKQVFIVVPTLCIYDILYVGSIQIHSDSFGTSFRIHLELNGEPMKHHLKLPNE